MDLTLKQPVSVWNREIKTGPKTFLLGLTKTAMAAVDGNVQKSAEEQLNAITKKL